MSDAALPCFSLAGLCHRTKLNPSRFAVLLRRKQISIPFPPTPRKTNGSERFRHEIVVSARGGSFRKRQRRRWPARIKAAFRELESLPLEDATNGSKLPWKFSAITASIDFIMKSRWNGRSRFESQPSLANKLPPNPPPIDNVHMASAMPHLDRDRQAGDSETDRGA